MQGILTSEIRSRIEDILRSPDSIDPDVFHEVASAYADLVTQINRRVAICNQWIDEGLRSEAIHMASLTPDLLQAVGQLDLGDSLEAWTVLCEANDAPVPQSTSWELAAYLNESWELEDQLQLELQALRKSMLQHDTLKDRIQVLRRLHERDKNNPIWQATISEHEVKRAEEIQNQLEVAIKENDLLIIGDIKSELLSADWIQPPPMELIELSITAKKNIKTSHTAIQFKKVARKLFQAMSEGDEKKARALATKWDSSITGGLTAPLSATEEAIPVFEWLDNLSAQEEAKSAFENLCDQLMQALDNQATVDELETIWNQLERLDLGIPSILENRYNQRRESFRRSAKQKNLLKIIVGSLAIVAIVTVVLILNQRADTNNKIILFQTELSSAIESQNIQIIERMLGTKDTTILSEIDGMLIAEWQSAQQLIHDDILRREAFSELLGRLGALSPINIPKTSLEQLDELARTKIEEEKSTALRESSEKAKRKHDESIRIEIDQTLVQMQGELRSSQAQLNNDSLPKAWKEFDDGIRSLKNRSVAVREQINKLFFPSIRQEEELRTLKSGIERLDIDAKINKLNSEQTTATINSMQGRHDLEDHMQFIEQLAGYDNLPYSEDIKKVKASGSAATAIIDWNSVREEIPEELSTLHQDAEKTNRILFAIQSLGKAHPENNSIEKIKEYITSIERMHNPDNSPNSQLSELFKEEDGSIPSWANEKLYKIVTQKGNYYGFDIKKITHRIEGSPAWLIQNCILTTDDYDYKNSTDIELSFSLISVNAHQEPTGFRQWKVEAVSKNLLHIPPSVNPDLWYLNLLLEVALIEDFDPIVRYALTSKIAHLHQSAAWHKFDRFESLDINYTPLETWFNPNDFIAERVSKKRQLEKFNEDSIRALIEESNQAYIDLLMQMPDKYTFIGHAINDSSGNKSGVLNVDSSVLNKNQRVFALRRAGASCRLVPVGNITNREIELDKTGSINFGSPLFIASSKKDE